VKGPETRGSSSARAPDTNASSGAAVSTAAKADRRRIEFSISIIKEQRILGSLNASLKSK
jgi:hypothetical protein